MNIIEKLQAKITENFTYAEELDGCNALANAIQAEYDKLCPKPSEFEGRKASKCWALYPNQTSDSYLRFNKGANFKGTELAIDKIPIGLDYRLCRWSIEDAKRIHGENE